MYFKNSLIIILDKATASLDIENESLIHSALSRLIQNKTVIVIAHRMCMGYKVRQDCYSGRWQHSQARYPK